LGNTTGANGSLLPGTNIGSFGRDIGVSGLTSLINSYNSNIAGKTLTPAGQALVTANLFTQAQLIALGATPQPLAVPPAGQVSTDQFFTFDLSLGWVLHANKVLHAFPERVTVQPQITYYNIFNKHNYDSPSNPISGVLSGTAGSLNGTTQADRTNLTSVGSGVFALGAPRQLEWGIKVTF
jgi:hypothetical protein